MNIIEQLEQMRTIIDQVLKEVKKMIWVERELKIYHLTYMKVRVTINIDIQVEKILVLERKKK